MKVAITFEWLDANGKEPDEDVQEELIMSATTEIDTGVALGFDEGDLEKSIDLLDYFGTWKLTKGN